MKMINKMGLAAVALMFSAAAFAQTGIPATTAAPASAAPNTEVKSQMQDMRKDIRAYDNKKAEAKKDINKGDLTDAQKDLAAAKADKQEIKADAKTLKSEGIKHPVKLADKQIKKADMKDLKADKADMKADRKTERKDIKDGNITGAQLAQADLKADKRDMKKDIRAAKRDGIKHPGARIK